MGTIMECFHIDGKRPKERNRLKIFCSRREIESTIDINRNEEMPSRQQRYWIEDQISTEQPLPQSREGHQDITRGPTVKDLPKGKGQW